MSELIITQALRACPFCSSKKAFVQNGSEILYEDGFYQIVWCSLCGVTTPDFRHKTEAEATAAWNTRSPIAASPPPEGLALGNAELDAGLPNRFDPTQRGFQP